MEITKYADIQILEDYAIPEEFSIFFWSEWPTSKTTGKNGVAIAYRLFMYGDQVAWDWALTHIKKQDILSAAEGRGMRLDAKEYAYRMVKNA